MENENKPLQIQKFLEGLKVLDYLEKELKKAERQYYWTCVLQKYAPISIFLAGLTATIVYIAVNFYNL